MTIHQFPNNSTPKVIDAERFNDIWETLPPKRWGACRDWSVFYMPEHISGHLVLWLAYKGSDYFEFVDSCYSSVEYLINKLDTALQQKITDQKLNKLLIDAYQVQDACNLSGVVHSFSRAISQLRELYPNEGTDFINHHPVCQMYADKIRDLSINDNLINAFGLGRQANEKG